MSKHFMYVVECADHSLYTGYAVDVAKRVAKHNAGTGAKYTKSRRPVQLRYAKEYPTKETAMQAEYAFKQQSRAEKMAALRRQGVRMLPKAPAVIDWLPKEDE